MANPAQFVTLDQARAFVQACNTKGVGGGVAPEDDSEHYVNDNSGIYLDAWADPGGIPRPEIGEARQYLLRFNPTPDGFQPAGFNIGLNLDVALRHGSLSYALDQLQKEVDDQIKVAQSGH